MNGNDLQTPKIPAWFLETFGIMRHADQGLRKLDASLRRAEGLEGQDPRLRERIQDVRAELWVAHAALTRMDVEAGEVLERISSTQDAGAGAPITGDPGGA
jgi:hypothetical protein